MADGTKIEWTDATINAINGCTVLSPGCTNCYAMKQAHRVEARRGLTMKTKGGMVWTGDVRFNDKALLQPLHWRRPRRIFWNAHGDMFHEKVPDEWIDRCFAVMALTPHHIHQVLTKRPERMREYMIALLDKKRSLFRNAGEGGIGWQTSEIMCAFTGEADEDAALGKPWRPLPNVWLGTSVEDQKRADERIPVLLDTPAAVRWISGEPLLGPLDLRKWLGWMPDDSLLGELGKSGTHGLRWVVIGGESGPKARHMHPDWVVSIHDQCAAAGVPFLFKQWGEYLPDQIGPGDRRSFHHPPGHVIYNKVGKKAAGRRLFGVEHNGFPA